MDPSIGQPLNRVDGHLKVTGAAMYTADHYLPHLAHAVLVTSSIAKGRIASMDTRAAEQIPGVLAILTHREKIKVAKDPSHVSPDSPADRALQLLQSDRIFYGGQPIGVAVAETLEAAMEAAQRVRVSYAEETPSVRIIGAEDRAYVPAKAGGGGDPGESHRGDFDPAFMAAPVRMEEIYFTQFQTHTPMEPHGTIAAWEGPDKLTVYDASQGIFGDRKRIAELLGIAPENVRVVSLFVGGGFGSKGPCWSHTALCAMTARYVQRPVKLVLRRPQTFGPVGFRTATQQTISLAAQTDGRLDALKNETYTHTSTFDEFTETATFPSRMLYSVANNKTVQKLVRSDIGTPSYTRAPGETPGTFALEVAMDELAVRLKMDPIELRLKNYAERDEDKNLPWSTKSLKECYRVGAERFGWPPSPPAPRSMLDGHHLVGWGMATALYPARRSPAAARARITPDGRILVEAGSQELGGGTYTIMSQIAADALGVAASMVTFKLGDTRYPETPVSGGSQTAATTGSAVDAACRALRKKLFDLMTAHVQTLGGLSQDASTQDDATPEDLTIENNIVRLKGTPGQATIASLLSSSALPYLESEAKSAPGPEAKQYSSYSFGAQFAEVRVDRDLGQLQVSRMVGVFAPGKILNAKTARSQFIGGMVWGIGFALHENTMYDERLGRIVNNNLAEYHVPTNADVPNIDVAWIDEFDDKVSPIGAKGIGEIGITGAAAAIANAVFSATGKRIRKLPITLDQLL